MTDAFLPMLDQKEGRIVNVGSGEGPGYVEKASAEDQKFLITPDVDWEKIEDYVKKNVTD